jgi:hypothetical protein
MSASRDHAASAPARSTGVSFEVERFAWSDGGRLEVVGRWYGIRGRRFLRPTLDVEVDGSPRRMLALLEHKPWAADDGDEWVAAFEWSGEPVDLPGAELAVGPELAVELPPPSGAPARKTRPGRQEGQRFEARPPRAQALEAELATARAETEELRDRLAAETRAREEDAAALAAAAAERDAAAAGRDAVTAQRDAALAERDAAIAARDAAQAERDAAVAQAANAASEREKAVRERAAVEHELAATAQARDKARAERNEWLTRARAAADEHGPAGATREPTPAPAPAPPESVPAAAESPPAPARPAPVKIPPPAEELPAGDPHAGDRPAGKARKTPLPPGGILLPPTGPGSHLRRSIRSGWARVLAPIALVILVAVVALLIAWAT